MTRLVVLGSLNVDLVVAGVTLPGPGETVTGGRFAQHQGGKGGNAAVAAARALRGGLLADRVTFIGAVGDDAHGRAAIQALTDEGVDVAAMLVVPGMATGVALIVVAPGGENQIAVASGANAGLDADEVGASMGTLLADGGVLLTNLEVPVAVVEAGVRAARAMGATTIINPAPAAALSAAALAAADILTPNEGELAALGDEGALRRTYPGLRLAITLGPTGARLIGDEPGATLIPAPIVAVVDSTGAGDTFNGVLAAGLLEGRPWGEAARRAVLAAALSVTVAGAREGMPLRPAIDAAAYGAAV